MALTYDGTNGITFNDGSQIGSANQMGIRNRIINGNMNINQRGYSGTVGSTGPTYTLDRWVSYNSQASKVSVQTSGSPAAPAGFANYLATTSLSAYSITSSDYFGIYQAIEGNNFCDFNFGTSNAKTLTVSFWVYSSLTGTFGGSLQNYAQSRSYPFSYTITSSNTWQKVSVTIPGDTGGTWVGQSNAGAAYLFFGLGMGSNVSGTPGTWASANYMSATGATSVVGTSFATFYITGVQLEAGPVATPFDFRMYGKELLLCQRYYTTINGVGTGSTGGSYYGTVQCYATTAVAGILAWLPVTMRAVPTVTYSGTFQCNNASGSGVTLSGTPTFYSSVQTIGVTWGGASGLVAGYASAINMVTTTYLNASAEL
jgi:hypothetical protein